MLETRTKATSTSHQTSTLPETQLVKIWTSASAETHQEETDTILTLHIKLIVSKALVKHCTVLYPITNINLKQLDVLHVLDKTPELFHSLKWVSEGCTIPFPIIVL